MIEVEQDQRESPLRTREIVVDPREEMTATGRLRQAVDPRRRLPVVDIAWLVAGRGELEDRVPERNLVAELEPRAPHLYAIDRRAAGAGDVDHPPAVGALLEARVAPR